MKKIAKIAKNTAIILLIVISSFSYKDPIMTANKILIHDQITFTLFAL